MALREGQTRDFVTSPTTYSPYPIIFCFFCFVSCSIQASVVYDLLGFDPSTTVDTTTARVMKQFHFHQNLFACPRYHHHCPLRSPTPFSHFASCVTYSYFSTVLSFYLVFFEIFLTALK